MSADVSMQRLEDYIEKHRTLKYKETEWNLPEKKIGRKTTTKVYNKLPQTVKDTRGSHMLYKKTITISRVKLTVGEKLGLSEDLERYIPGRCTISITICNSDDATQLHKKKKNNSMDILSYEKANI